jgi:hypothetical protein
MRPFLTFFMLFFSLSNFAKESKISLFTGPSLNTFLVKDEAVSAILTQNAIWGPTEELLFLINQENCITKDRI